MKALKNETVKTNMSQTNLAFSGANTHCLSGVNHVRCSHRHHCSKLLSVWCQSEVTFRMNVIIPAFIWTN